MSVLLGVYVADVNSFFLRLVLQVALYMFYVMLSMNIIITPRITYLVLQVCYCTIDKTIKCFGTCGENN